MNQPTVLVVEDNPDDAALVRGLLSTGLSHARVHLASNGRELRAYLRGEWPYDDPLRYHPPAVIVMDLELPDVTGFEMLEWLAEEEDFLNIPVIMSAADQDEAERAYSLGVRHYNGDTAGFSRAPGHRQGPDRALGRLRCGFIGQCVGGRPRPTT